MKLCLDVGNTTIFCGVAKDNTIILKFRYDSKDSFSSDQFGLFLCGVLRENDINRSDIEHISFCSVVPQLDHSILSACIKYFKIEPFILKPGVKTKLKIKYRNPLEVGADIISDAIAATHLFPKKNIIVISFGTATTFSVINSESEHLGGVIMPGLELSMNALKSNTAKLSTVEIIKSKRIVGRSTKESVQSGLYFGHLAMVEGITARIKQEAFAGKPCVVIGTGGFSALFAQEKIFTSIEPDLVLQGLFIALDMNVYKKEAALA